MSDAIISVEHLGKRYRLGAGGSGEPYNALLRELVSFEHPLDRLR